MATRGRPTNYKPEYCKKIIKYFDVAPYYEREFARIGKDGQQWSEYKLTPNDLPFFSKFARSIKASMQTLHEWADKHPDFAEAFKEAKEMQKVFMLINGLNGHYASAPFIFAMKNMFGWRDQRDMAPADALSEKFTFILQYIRRVEEKKVAQSSRTEQAASKAPGQTNRLNGAPQEVH